jgi:colanic acid/amylovoran biosynthesis protein
MLYDLLIVNQPLNNRGDEAAHRALLHSILNDLPNVKILVLFIDQNQNSVDQFDVHSPRVSYVNLKSISGWRRAVMFGIKYKCLFLSRIHPTARKIVCLFNQANMVLCAPGGICMGGFQNWRHVALLSVAKALNKPIAYYGRSIGPFPTLTPQNRLFKKISIGLLQYFSFLSLRDKKSMDLAESLNVKYEPTVDSAFLELPNVDIPLKISNLIIANHPYIVFVPNLLIWHFAYKGKVSLDEVLKFYKKILDCIIAKYPDHKIVMLPQTFNYGSYRGDDINFFRDLKQYAQCEKMIIIPDTYSSDIQQTIISKADCIIGARYHSVVFAINQAVPFVALSYEHKIQGLLEALNKTESMVDITKTFDSEENMNMTIELFSKSLSVAHKDVGAQKNAKEMARSCFDKFVKCFIK